MIIEKCHHCIGSQACENQVVNECLPVSAFGGVSDQSVKVATIGLNPALNEFYSYDAIKDRDQRLAMLNDYNLTNRADLRDADLGDAIARREGYFKNAFRECHNHFEKLESVVGRIDPAWSYITGSAVHIDLVACATKVRWGDLSAACQTELLANCRVHFLTTLSSLPNGTLLLLDGAKAMQEMKQLGLTCRQEGGEPAIYTQERWNRCCIGKLKRDDKEFPVIGWSTPVGKLTLYWRYDLAFWVRGTLRRNPYQSL